MKKGNATQAPPKRGSGSKIVSGGASTVRTGTAKGKLPKWGR